VIVKLNVRKKMIIALSILFIFFCIVTILILFSEDFIRNRDLYQYLHSDLAMRNRSTLEFELEISKVKTKLIPYYIATGICGTLALASLAGDIYLFVAKK